MDKLHVKEKYEENRKLNDKLGSSDIIIIFLGRECITEYLHTPIRYATMAYGDWI